MLTAEQAVEDAQTARISGGAEDGCSALEHVGRERLVLDAGVVVVVTAIGRLVIHQFNE